MNVLKQVVIINGIDLLDNKIDLCDILLTYNE